MSGKDCDQELITIQARFHDFEQRFVVENLNTRSEILKTKEKNDALESQLQVEKKIKSDLEQKLRSMQKHKEDAEDLRSQLASSLTIKDSDQTRMMRAQEMFRIGKEYTGIRWDFDTPPTICRGYVINSSRMTLEHFEYNKNEEAAVVEQLWQRVRAGAGAPWLDVDQHDPCNFHDKENIMDNL